MKTGITGSWHLYAAFAAARKTLGGCANAWRCMDALETVPCSGPPAARRNGLVDFAVGGKAKSREIREGNMTAFIIKISGE